jgi:hypothetical protein
VSPPPSADIVHPRKRFVKGGLAESRRRNQPASRYHGGPQHPLHEKETARKPTQTQGAAGGEEDYVTGGKSSTHNTRLPDEPPESDE